MVIVENCDSPLSMHFWLKSLVLAKGRFALDTFTRSTGVLAAT
jgi:hypothetical protein